jgi:hypothetical protein
MAGAFDKELDNVKALAEGAKSFVATIFLVAIIALVVQQGSAAATIIQSFFRLLAWMTAIIVSPLQPGANVDTSATVDGPVGTFAENPPNTGTWGTGTANMNAGQSASSAGASTGGTGPLPTIPTMDVYPQSIPVVSQYPGAGPQ